MHIIKIFIQIQCVNIVIKHLNKESIAQYQAEEKTLMAFRLASARYRVKELLEIMSKEEISKPEKVEQLARELSEHNKTSVFLKAKTMGQIVKQQLKQELKASLIHVPKTRSKIAD